MPPTLVLSPRQTEDAQALWRAAIEMGWEVERLPGWSCPQDFHPHRPVLYGEPMFVESVAQALSLSPVEPDPCWLTTLPYEFVRRRITASTVGQARLLKERAFVKPPVHKTFPAKVYASGQDLDTQGYLPDETPVLISDPVWWEAEWRFFIGPSLIDATPYAANMQPWTGQETYGPEVFQLLCDLLATVTLSRALVVDIGYIQGVGPAVVEANPVTSSGLYRCNPAVVLQVLEAACHE